MCYWKLSIFKFFIRKLVKILKKDSLKYLNQEFDNNVLDLVKKKRFYSDDYMRDFEKFEEELHSIVF